MIEPTQWLSNGIMLDVVNGKKVFKFTQALQQRSDELRDRAKAGILTVEEQAEFEGISELAEIFIYANVALTYAPTEAYSGLHAIAA
jgi:hypothetical protein